MDPLFVERVGAVAERLRGCPVDDPDVAVAWLAEHVPFDDPEIAELRGRALEGAAAGWLLPKQNGAIRFGRVAKDLCGFSVDAVRMGTTGRPVSAGASDT